MKSVYIVENRVLTRVLDRSNMVVPTDDLLGYSQLILDGVYDVPLTN